MPRWGCGVGGACRLAPPTPGGGPRGRETDQSESGIGGRGTLPRNLSATVDQTSSAKPGKNLYCSELHLSEKGQTLVCIYAIFKHNLKHRRNIKMLV